MNNLCQISAKFALRTFWVLNLTGVLMLASCQSVRPLQQAETEPIREREITLPQTGVPKAALLEETPILVDEVVPPKEGAEEQYVFPERETPPEVQPLMTEYPDKLIKGIKDPDAIVPVQLQFDALPLTEIVPLFSALLNFSYLIDPAVKGAVTMTVDSEMTAREAWQVFEHILWLAGAYASKNPGFIHIMPFSKMPKERRLLADHDPMANVEVAMIPVLHVKSSEIAGEIKPFMTEGATITDLVRANSLLIVEAPPNMPKLRELVSRLDVKGEASWPHITLRCYNVPVDVVQQELEALLPVLGLPVTSSTPSGGQIKLTAIPRLNVLLASAALQDVLTEVERWVRVLDRADRGEQENLFFYNVRHSTADMLSEALGVFFNASATRGGRPSETQSTSAKATPAGTQGQSRPSLPRAVEDGERLGIFDTPVIVYVDQEHNRLTIRTTHRAYALVNALLSRLDVPRRQVMIQAIVTEITLNKSTEFGFTYAAKQKLGSYDLIHTAAHAAGFSFADDSAADIAGQGLGVLFRKNADQLAFIKAVAGETNVRVLSAPQILAANDKESIINVGDKVPVITGDYTETSAVGSSFRNIQYQDTGVILTVTPHITAGNEVKVDVKQEVSAAIRTETSDIQSPTIRNRTLQTSLVIPDGATVILGGLIETSSEDSYSGVPGLMDVPYIGRLFRTNLKRDNRTELLVLITANVIDSPSKVEAIARRYELALREIQEKLGY